MSWSRGDRVENPVGQTGTVTQASSAPTNGDPCEENSAQVVKVDYDDGHRPGWLWGSQFRAERR